MKKKQMLMLMVVVLLAANMRAPFTGVGSLTTLIRADLGVSNTVMGLLTTIPMVVFAVVSLLGHADFPPDRPGKDADLGIGSDFDRGAGAVLYKHSRPFPGDRAALRGDRTGKCAAGEPDQIEICGQSSPGRPAHTPRPWH